MVAVDLGALKEKAQAAEPVDVETAFLVIIRDGGMIQVVPDINLPVVPKRTVTGDEIEIAALKIASDMQADKTASIMQMRMGQAARAMQQQAEHAALANSLKL